MNHQIRVTPVRLIDQNENQVGIIETDQARRMAMEADLDLVEVAPLAKPPVCRIMDYGKWKYEQKKKDQRAKSHRHEVVLKEVRMRPKTDPHDQMIKVNRAREFLGKGNKVQFTMLFRGREMAHLDIGHQAFNRIKQELANVAKIERDFKMEGRRMTMVMTPLEKTDKPAKPKAAKSVPPPAAGPQPQPEPQAQPAPQS